MSFYGGGGGGGWGPPAPPFFNQPPPPIPVPVPYFPNEPPRFPPGMQPDLSQQGYNPYIPVPEQPQYPVSYDPVTQQMTMLTSVPPPVENPVERERDMRSEHRSPPRKHSPSPRGREGRGKRQSQERGHHYRDVQDKDDYPRGSRQSLSDNRGHLRLGSDERGRARDRNLRARKRSSSGGSSQGSPAEKPKVDIDALLQDERLRNVLFAGISKATAKLEQSLNSGKGEKEQSDFDSSQGRSHLFPSASAVGSQKPKSILKRGKEDESGGSKALNSLTALERTLQILRGKGDMTSSTSDRSSAEKNPPLKNALSQLATYEEGNDEGSYLYEKKEKFDSRKEKKATSSHPFWSVPSELETAKKERDSFDVKEKMFEEWRQSIGKASESSKSSSRDHGGRNTETGKDDKPILKKRDMKGGDGENQEELDSTVQNILHSIGFNFDLSRRMQELARKRKQKEEGGSPGINTTGSFMDRGDMLAEELRSSLLHSGADLSDIEELIKEARASSQVMRQSSRAARSPGSVHRGSSYGKDSRDSRDSIPRSERRGKEEMYDKRSESNYRGFDQWERVSPERHSGQQIVSPPRRNVRDRGSLSPLSRDKPRGSAPSISERFRDDDNRDEYYYPDKEFADTPPSVPLLTSFSSRRKTEDLSSGLLKSTRVENFRVMSRQSNELEDDSAEVRRIILPAKGDHRDIAPVDRDQSFRTVIRKRSASPLAPQFSKERRLSPKFVSNELDYLAQSPNVSSCNDRRPPDNQYRNAGRGPSPQSTKRPAYDRDSPAAVDNRRRSPSPSSGRLKGRYRERSISPFRRRSRSRSPYRQRSPRRRSPSPDRHRSRSRSRSPYRQRSPRRRSPSPGRKRRSPPRRSPGRSSPYRRRSPYKKRNWSRPGDKGKPPYVPAKSRRPDQSTNKPVKDLSKLPEQDRKAELNKMLSAKGKPNDDSKKPQGKETVGKTDSIKQSDEKWKEIVDVFDGITDSCPLTRLAVTTKAKELSVNQHKDVLIHLGVRKAQVKKLKLDLDRLKKAQNELMRKSQRSGLGNNDPHLKVNNLSQMELEKEIDRLSVPDLKVELKSNLEQTLNSIQAKFLKNTDSGVSSKATTPKAPPKSETPKASAATDSSTGSGDAKGDGVKAEQGSSSAQDKSSSWTSVAVKDEALPEIKNSDKKSDNKESEKKDRKSSSSASSTKSKRNVYYEYVDSGNHWCSHCRSTCSVLEHYFNHCHSRKHLNKIKDVPKVWRESKENNKSTRKVGQAQTRRMKGSEMMIPITGFYCALCHKFCGDFKDAEVHMKTDSHYDNYLEHLKVNPSYEKKLLLEKSKATFEKKKGDSEPAPPPPPPPPPPSSSARPASPESKKGKKNKSHLRQKKGEEEKEAVLKDNIEMVDMELDEEDERDDDVDVKSKVPKLKGKPTASVTEILSSLPETSAAVAGVEMKSSQGDEVKSLDTFLTIAAEKNAKSAKKKSSKLPVISAKAESDVKLSDIPIPETSIPSIDVIPLPSGNAPTSKDSVTGTVTAKTLKEVQDEKQREIDEEKKMMGIDVDAEEEKPLAPIKRPPPIGKIASLNKSEVEKEGANKPKSLESLFAKVSQKTSQKSKPRTSCPVQTSDLEDKIELEIQKKLAEEKEKMKKEQEKKERKEKILEEKKLMKKKVHSDSSSEEESESEEEEEDVVESTESGVIPMPEGSSEDTAVQLTAPAVIIEKSVTTQQLGDGFICTAESSKTDYEDMEMEVTVKDEMCPSLEAGVDMKTNFELKEEVDIDLLKQDTGNMEIEEIAVKMDADSLKTDEVKLNDEAKPQEDQVVEEKMSDDKMDFSQSTRCLQEPESWAVVGSGDPLSDLKSTSAHLSLITTTMDVEKSYVVTSGADTNSLGSAPDTQVGNVEPEAVPHLGMQTKDRSDNTVPKIEIADPTTESGNQDTNSQTEIKPVTDLSDKMSPECMTEESKAYSLSPDTAGTVTSTTSDVEPSISLPKNVTKQAAAVKQAVQKKGKKQVKKVAAAVKALESESDLLGVLTATSDTVSKEGQKKLEATKKTTPKRGCKAKKTAPPVEPSKEVEEGEGEDEVDIDMFMKGFVVLSEVTEEETPSNTDASPSQSLNNAEDINRQGDGVLEASNDDDDKTMKTNKIEDQDAQIEATVESSDVSVSTKDALVVEKVIKGKRTPARGKGRGKKGAVVKMDLNPPSTSETTDTPEILPPAVKEVTDRNVSEEVIAVEVPSAVDILSSPAVVEEEEAEALAVPVSRTRRSTRAATVATTSPAVKTNPGRQTRSRGKKTATAPKVECEEAEVENVTSAMTDSQEPEVVEQPVSISRTMDSREAKNTVEDTAAPHIDTEDLEAGEMPVFQAAEDAGADSDSTIVGDSDDEPNTFHIPQPETETSQDMQTDLGAGGGDSYQHHDSGDSGLTAGTAASHANQPGYQQSSSQPRDPPMSGIVGDLEAPEAMVVSAQEMASQETVTNTADLEGLPTAGLSLGLEDDADSLDFTMAEVE